MIEDEDLDKILMRVPWEWTPLRDIANTLSKTASELNMVGHMLIERGLVEKKIQVLKFKHYQTRRCFWRRKK